MIRILHVSDIHFGPKHLPRLSEAVTGLVSDTRPDAVVVSGDLTQRARRRQFLAARAWIDALEAPVAWVPGNHDVPMYRCWERLLSPFGAWRRHFAPALVADVHGDGFSIFGLNTAFNWTTKHGRVSRRDLVALERRIDAAPPVSFRVVTAHHPLAASARLGGEPVARRGAETLSSLGRRDVALVLSGHLHHGFWVEPAAGSRLPLAVHAGTTTSSRGRGVEKRLNSLNRIEANADRIRVERCVWSAGSGRFEVRESGEFSRRAPTAGAF